jgi:5-methylcytosine-specific restriction endonuclease McrA
MTIDHIHPKSRGGKDTWENLTCSCMRCNTKKGDRTPQEAGMVLYSKPKKPFSRMALILEKSNVSDWKEYIYS